MMGGVLEADKARNVMLKIMRSRTAEEWEQSLGRDFCAELANADAVDEELRGSGAEEVVLDHRASLLRVLATVKSDNRAIVRSPHRKSIGTYRC